MQKKYTFLRFFRQKNTLFRNFLGKKIHFSAKIIFSVVRGGRGGW